MRKLIFILIFVLHNPVWVSAQGPSILPSDSAYNADTWNGSTLSPTQNAVRDKIVSMEASALTNPMDSAGDIIIGGALGAPAKLDAGTQNYLLQANGAAAPTWVTDLTIGDITVGGGNINTGNIPLIIGDNTTDSIILRTDGGDVTVPEGTITLATTAQLLQLDTDADGDIDTIDATLWATKQGLDAELTDLAAGIMTFFSAPLASAPGSPVDGKIYCADNEAAGWDPCTVDGTVDYLVLYDGASYKALIDKDAVWQIAQASNLKNVLTKNAADGTWSGQSITLTAHETIAFGNTVFVNSDGEAALADADAAATMPCIGICVVGGEAAATVTILTNGWVTETDWNFTTVGARLYVSETAGGVENTLANISDTNDVVQIIGIALHADTMLVQPSLTEIVLE